MVSICFATVLLSCQWRAMGLSSSSIFWEHTRTCSMLQKMTSMRWGFTIWSARMLRRHTCLFVRVCGGAVFAFVLLVAV